MFSGIQGEGTLVGERHIFIRMGGCPFRCHYCDTPLALVPQENCLVEDPPGSRKFHKIPNPISPDKLAEIVAKFANPPGLHRAIAITGGEPLWQSDYLRVALPHLRNLGKRIYLETAGGHVEELKSILEFVDVIAMDFKPPSATAMKPMWAAQREFLRLALVKQVIVKIVVTRSTNLTDLQQIRDVIAEVDRTIPVVIQPVVPAWKVKSSATVAHLLSWQSMLSEKLEQVRIIPQCHKVIQDR